MGCGGLYLLCLKTTGGGLDYENENATIIVGLAGHSAVFSACQVLFHTIYNEPVSEVMAHYALPSVFFVCGRGGGWALKS